MSTLVHFLAAGVNGAGQGTATFVLRGTTTSALPFMWEDFEATSHPPSNVVQLDQNGSASIYCDVYCDVEVRNVDNVLLRQYTIGTGAATVEVQSPSFTGTDYDGAPANTAGEPVTLADVLDRWFTSSGATDWQVLYGGVPTNIQSALAGIAGMFINVKDPQFGAVGDGVTDDTTAIMGALAAATAAGGGIVFFPPGTYQVTTLNPSTPEVTMMGCGPNSSNIRGRLAGSAVLSFTDNTPAASKRVTGLKFTSSASYNVLIGIEENQRIAIDNCEFDQTNVTTAAISRIDADGSCYITIDSCKFDVGTSSAGIRNLSDDGESFISVKTCLFEVSAGFTGTIIDGPDFSVAQCKFDASAVTSGVYFHVDASSNEFPGKYIGNFIGNKFVDGGSNGFVFLLDDMVNGTVFHESANEFSGFVDPVTVDDNGHIYALAGQWGQLDLTDCQMTLGSRFGKVIYCSLDDSPYSVSLFVIAPSAVANTVIITIPSTYTNTTGSTQFIFTGYQQFLPPGAMTKFIIFNERGGNTTVRCSTGWGSGQVSLTVANNGAAFFNTEVAVNPDDAPITAIYGSQNIAL